MSWPKPKTPTKDRQSRAPYNFVPLPEKVVPAVDLLPQDQYYEDRYTGHLDCDLTTRSPVYVRCGLTSSEHQKGKETKEQTDFFFTDPETREPVVPGSSLRGLVRTIVEIVSYGKVQPVSQQKLFYRAVADPMTTLRESYQRLMESVQAGYVEESDGAYSIRPARAIGGNTFFKVTEGVLKRGGVRFTSLFSPGYRPQYHECWFRPSTQYPDSVAEVSPRSVSGFEKGVLVCSGPFGRKKRKHWIVPAKDSSEPLPIPQETVRQYFDTLSPHQKQKPFDPITGCLITGNPVFYLQEGQNVVDFGPTRNFRVSYRQAGETTATSAQAFVPDSLRNPNEIDLAEAVFGYVRPKKEQEDQSVSLAGRVFLSDARLKDGQSLKDLWLMGNPDDVLTPKILSGPKPTTFAHYVVQQKPDRLQVRGGRGSRNILDLSHYASPTPEETVIRGHKLYWHKGDAGRKEIEEEASFDPERDTQHTWLKPLRSGVAFGFRIHFENLSKIELGALLWALTLPGPGTYCHKLGMGKPLGMGAVEIESDLLLTERKARYGTLFDGDQWQLGEGILDAALVQRQSLEAFEEAILSHKEINPGKRIQSLAELPRIQHLLALLSWPGPDPRATEYVTELREFTQRKVLPTPLTVAKQAPAPSIVPEPATKQPPTPPAPRPPVKQPPTPPIYKPKPQAPAPVTKPAPPPDAGRHAGLVTYYNFAEGRGTVLLDGSDEEVEVRSSQLRANVHYLAKDQRVTFAITKDNEGVHLDDVGPE